MADKSSRKEQRAEAKAEYKTRTRRVKELDRNEDPKLIQEIIGEHLERSNALYPLVKRKLDGTAADSRHMRELVNLGQTVSHRINVSSKPIEMKCVIKRLMREVNEDQREFFRFITEQHVKKFLLGPPTFEFFYGAFKGEKIEANSKVKRAPRERMIEVRVVTAKEKDMELDVEQDTTPKEVELINAQINRLALNKKDGIPFFATLADPTSFTQTVENIFHTSFLVKEGRVGVKLDKSKKPLLVVDADQEVERPSVDGGCQSILSFSMEDYKKWISKSN